MPQGTCLPPSTPDGLFHIMVRGFLELKTNQVVYLTHRSSSPDGTSLTHLYRY